ncbi:hypothetical protein [Bdellovibrio bacteriovorus]|uniref:Uncharacterized protein n=1 Tax=Bdellovibrio bacteriovorus str. Tiberius TaxID=1069642 RepID=K7ZG03_BDEBC|nr:hypothetical protein [Bdellovibrio bacteriovorus]AFY02022.1 hypothetical protein Bdt_2339 [Bdellovibrio bacteriovorus str. Tiberius]
MKIVLFAGMFMFGIHASASQELSQVIACHEALDGKSDARTFKLETTSPTPFTLISGKRIYFITDHSVSVLDHKYANQSMTVKLEEKGQPFYRTINFQKDGTVGNVSFEDTTKEAKAQAVTPKAQLDPDSIALIKKELLRQMNSVTGEYQNKYDPEDTLHALNICRQVESKELAASIDKQSAFYEKLLHRKASYKYQKAKAGHK